MKTIDSIVRAGIALPRNSLRFGGEVGQRVTVYGGSFFRQTNELLFPPDPVRFARHLEMYGPLHDAEIGFKAMRYGESKDDMELVYFGGAMAVRAVVQSFENEAIPALVTATIVEGIIENEIVPEEQPLLSDEIVQRSRHPIDKYGKTILQLFPREVNTL